MARNIRIVEVGPRDGLQNEKSSIPTAIKLSFIDALASAGLREIEATSFVSPKWVPQLGDAEQLWPALPPGPLYSALIPNAKGLARAIDLGVDRIALFTASSETFVQRNINMSIEQSLAVFADLIAEFRSRKPSGWIRGYVSTAFECPYEGWIDPRNTANVAKKLVDIGVDEVALGDTIGVAVPAEVAALTKIVTEAIPVDRIAYHFHDTRGTAIANVLQALELGVGCFDSSAGGLGGCPFAPGAGGNLATEDLVYFLERSGLPTKVDLYRLSQASLAIFEVLGRSPSAKSQLAQLSLSGTCPT
jgi:hydroxymethylglutaryl-CoA lyase